MISAIVKTNASATTVFTDFLSVPKIIGIGPIMITPAPFTLPLSPVLPDLPAEIKMDKIMIRITHCY